MPHKDPLVRKAYLHDYHLKFKKDLTDDQRKVMRKRIQKWRHRSKANALAVYGPRCARCGYDDIRALCLDHVNGGGSSGNKRMCTGLREAERSGFSKDYQILCANCNMIKALEMMNGIDSGRY